LGFWGKNKLLLCIHNSGSPNDLTALGYKGGNLLFCAFSVLFWVLGAMTKFALDRITHMLNFGKLLHNHLFSL
jgi:hypothetical protein